MKLRTPLQKARKLVKELRGLGNPASVKVYDRDNAELFTVKYKKDRYGNEVFQVVIPFCGDEVLSGYQNNATQMINFLSGVFVSRDRL